MKKQDTNHNMNRRDFLKRLGGGLAVGSLVAASSCRGKEKTPLTESGLTPLGEIPTDQMTFRTVPSSGQKVSLLGYGCMRWPTLNDKRNADYDQEQINHLVDYAMEHGVNYFDTAPVYCKGMSEAMTGAALKRHPRDKYLIATKLSNMSAASQTLEGSKAMYYNSFKQLQVDYIDFYLLHSVGSNINDFHKRFVDNGMLDFLLEERRQGRIRHLGFSFHGNQESLDYVLSLNDTYHWDFVQIQLNYIEWSNPNRQNLTARYQYEALQKYGIPAVIMEPLLGGRLSKVNDHIAATFKQRAPQNSVASWAFRFAGSLPGVLTVLSGMTYMEHLEDNLRSYCPLEPLSEDDFNFLEKAAQLFLHFPTVPCTACNYCMPCPYGIDIPGIFQHYNKCINEGNVPASSQDSEYRKARRAYLVSYSRSIDLVRQADHCIGCGKCRSECPQHIDIPRQLQHINDFVENLKQGKEF